MRYCEVKSATVSPTDSKYFYLALQILLSGFIRDGASTFIWDFKTG